MRRIIPRELASRIDKGLLAFPVTHFDEQGESVKGHDREHIAALVENDPAALFAAGGTGEYLALTLADYSNVVKAVVDEAAGRVLVLAGRGYGGRMAMEFACAAEQAGADGLLLFPPYLANVEPAGLIAHARGVCDSTRLGVIFYSRDNAVLNESALEQLCDCCPNMIGLKDGHGDIELEIRRLESPRDLIAGSNA